MDLLKALFQIVVVYVVLIIIPETILTYLQRSKDKMIDDFCREEHQRNEERRSRERKDK